VSKKSPFFAAFVRSDAINTQYMNLGSSAALQATPLRPDQPLGSEAPATEDGCARGGALAAAMSSAAVKVPEDLLGVNRSVLEVRA
jgi:hypothetical protein